MTIEQQLLDRLKTIRPPFLDMLGCQYVAFDADTGELTFDYEIGLELCHSGNIIQGGFIAAMLDATMSHAVFSLNSEIIGLGTLEIKVMYLERALAGKYRCVARADRVGGSIAFLSAELFNEDRVCVCTSTSTAKLTRKKSNSGSEQT